MGWLGILWALGALSVEAQRLPASVRPLYTHLEEDSLGVYIRTPEGGKAYEVQPAAFPTLRQMIGIRIGTKDGIAIDFLAPDFEGRLYYGFLPFGDGRYPYPVYVRSSPKIVGGKAELPIRSLRGRYDMINWEEKGWGYLGYRVVDATGAILYDGKIGFGYDSERDSFAVLNTLHEGPLLTYAAENHYGAWFRFALAPQAADLLRFGAGVDVRSQPSTGLDPASAEGVRQYRAAELGGPDFLLELPSASGTPLGGTSHLIRFTAEEKRDLPIVVDTRGAAINRFTFGYASDSRDNQGGGERNIFGTNAYVLKRIGALAAYRGVAFLQFTGDLIDGYISDPGQMELQYANFKRALEPYWGTFPVICAPGNHEVFVKTFEDRERQQMYLIERYPYADSSSQALFAREFANPVSTLRSEDGSRYDPDPATENFPPYAETVFTYSYGNVAIVVLNSNYWYTVRQSQVPYLGGNIHAYIMDNQLAWLAQQLDSLERDDRIRHVFVTCHTPLFPNGGHVQDDMWYGGDNRFRPYVAGKPVEKGIIERRDEILDLLVNQSTKVRATLTGDEHNYCRTHITEAMPRYPEGWDKARLTLTRDIWQINNGSAGAPYYAQERTPWSDYTFGFTTQVALVLVHVEGEKITVEVQNPDTLEPIDQLELR